MNYLGSNSAKSISSLDYTISHNQFKARMGIQGEKMKDFFTRDNGKNTTYTFLIGGVLLTIGGLVLTIILFRYMIDNDNYVAYCANYHGPYTGQVWSNLKDWGDRVEYQREYVDDKKFINVITLIVGIIILVMSAISARKKIRPTTSELAISAFLGLATAGIGFLFALFVNFLIGIFFFVVIGGLMIYCYKKMFIG